MKYLDLLLFTIVLIIPALFSYDCSVDIINKKFHHTGTTKDYIIDIFLIVLPFILAVISFLFYGNNIFGKSKNFFYLSLLLAGANIVCICVASIKENIKNKKEKSFSDKVTAISEFIVTKLQLSENIISQIKNAIVQCGIGKCDNKTLTYYFEKNDYISFAVFFCKEKCNEWYKDEADYRDMCLFFDDFILDFPRSPIQEFAHKIFVEQRKRASK